jgi:HK97 family phage prohead protease
LPGSRPPAREPKYLPAEIHGYAVLWGRRGAKGECYLRGCFDESLAEVAAGRRSVALDVDHGLQTYGSTREGALRIWTDDVGLRFALKPQDNAEGEWLVEQMRAGAFTGCSTGAWTIGRPDIHRATLDRVTLCWSGPSRQMYPSVLETAEHLHLYELFRGQLRRFDRRTPHLLGEPLDKPKTDPAAARYRQWLAIQGNPFYF